MWDHEVLLRSPENHKLLASALWQVPLCTVIALPNMYGETMLMNINFTIGLLIHLVERPRLSIGRCMINGEPIRLVSAVLQTYGQV